MSTFDDRESAFEAKFAHDADMIFKAEMLRNRLAGLWAAELLGKTGDGTRLIARRLELGNDLQFSHRNTPTCTGARSHSPRTL